MNQKNVFLLLFIFCFSNAYSGLLEINPGTGGYQCTGEWIKYTVSCETYLIENDIYWTVEGGTYRTTDTHTEIEVNWNNQSDQGTIKVSCNLTGYGFYEWTFYFYMKTLYGRTGPAFFQLTNPVDFGAHTIDLGVNKIKYPKKSGDQNTYWVEDYQWLLPSGWIYDGITYDGQTTFIATDEITVTTHNYNGGTLKVWGVNECNETLLSNPTVETITRTFPDFDITYTNDNSWIEGDNSSFTTSVPDWDWASYQWSVSTGWSYTGTGNSITVLPNGCDGSINCIVTAGTNSHTETINIDFETFNPQSYPNIIGDYYICSSESYTVNNLPAGATVYWSPGPNLTISSGQSTNTCTFTKNGQNGSSYINATITTNCGTQVSLPNFDVHIGTPTPNISYAYDQSCNCQIAMPIAGEEYYFLVQSDNPSTNDNDYVWAIEPPFGSEYFPWIDNGEQIYFTAPEEGIYTFRLRQNWVCGWSDFATEYVEFYESGYWLSFVPNPTNNISIISIETNSRIVEFDSNAEWDLEIYDQNQSLKRKRTKIRGKTSKIKTSGWEEGIYFVKVKYKDKIIKGRLVVTK